MATAAEARCALSAVPLLLLLLPPLPRRRPTASNGAAPARLPAQMPKCDPALCEIYTALRIPPPRPRATRSERLSCSERRCEGRASPAWPRPPARPASRRPPRVCHRRPEPGTPTPCAAEVPSFGGRLDAGRGEDWAPLQFRPEGLSTRSRRPPTPTPPHPTPPTPPVSTPPLGLTAPTAPLGRRVPGWGCRGSWGLDGGTDRTTPGTRVWKLQSSSPRARISWTAFFSKSETISETNMLNYSTCHVHILSHSLMFLRFQ